MSDMWYTGGASGPYGPKNVSKLWAQAPAQLVCLRKLGTGADTADLKVTYYDVGAGVVV